MEEINEISEVQQCESIFSKMIPVSKNSAANSVIEHNHLFTKDVPGRAIKQVMLSNGYIL